MDLKNLSLIRHSFANTVFTHKVQEIAAEYQEKKSFYVKIINITVVSLVLITLFFQAFNSGKIWISYIGACITISEVIFLIVQLTFNFEKRMDLHKKAALKFMALRDSYMFLITDIMNESINSEVTIIQREKLKEEYHIICESAPQTDRKDFYEAQKRLNKKEKTEGEDFTWSDEEIDHFLPETLRLTKKG